MEGRDLKSYQRETKDNLQKNKKQNIIKHLTLSNKC